MKVPNCKTVTDTRISFFLGCVLSSFLATMSGFGSIGSMTAIAIDRLQRLSNPLQSLDYEVFGQQRSFKLILLVWIYAVVLASPPLFYSGYGPRGTLCRSKVLLLSKRSYNLSKSNLVKSGKTSQVEIFSWIS